MSAAKLLSGPKSFLGGDADKAFAILIPKSPSAEEAFDDVVSTINEDHVAYQRAYKFMYAIPPIDAPHSIYTVQSEWSLIPRYTWLGKETYKLAEQGTLADQLGTDHLVGDVRNFPAPRWTGAYKLELEALSVKKSSWLLGIGPSSAAGASSQSADLILAPRTNAWCSKSLHSRHAELYFSEESLSLMIKPIHTVAVTGPLGYQELQDGPNVVMHGSTIHFGDCIYKVEFTDYADSDEFRQELSSLMGAITNNRSSLHEHLWAPSTTGRKLIMGRFMFSVGAMASGSFGSVAAGITTDDGSCVAVKRFLNPNQEKIEQHAWMMKAIGEHENIIQLLEYIQDFDSPQKALYAFYQPLVDRSLMAMLANDATRKIAPSDQMYLFQDWLRGLDWLHTRKGMMHRDINPNNLGVIKSKPPRGVVLDLDSVTIAKISYDYRVGTLQYMAPETIDIKEWEENATPQQMEEDYYVNVVHYESSVDVWALGLSLWTMIKTSPIPWSMYEPCEAQTSNPDQVTLSRFKGLRRMMARTRRNCNPHDYCTLTLLHFVEQMVVWEADDRPTTANLLVQVKEHLEGH